MLSRTVAVIAVGCLAFASAASAVTPTTQRPAATAITGTYHSNYDDVTLVQDGNLVHGTYVCCGGGTIEGRIIEGRIIRYTWRQPSAWGMGIWKIDAGRLGGTWGNQQNEVDGGRWDLERVKPTSKIAN